MDLPPNKLGIVVTTDPVDAKISLDDDPTDQPQPQPRIVQVGSDEKLTLRIESPGYRTKKVTLDGRKLDPKNPRIVVKLNEEKGKGQASSARPPPTPKTAAAAPAPAPAPAPISTARPANCAVEDWDPYQHKCLKHPTAKRLATGFSNQAAGRREREARALLLLKSEVCSLVSGEQRSPVPAA